MSTSKVNTECKPAEKHRSCDECRARKVSCSKEQDGCSRCKRDGISCVYSEQKRMGRPRKRRRVEQDISIDAPWPSEQREAEVVALSPGLPEWMRGDFDFGFLDQDFGLGGFGDGLGVDDGMLINDPLMFGQIQEGGEFMVQTQQNGSEKQLNKGVNGEYQEVTAQEKGFMWQYGVDPVLSEIDFSTPSSNSECLVETPNSTSESTHTVPLSDCAAIISLSQEASASQSQDENCLTLCDCLPSLYLALASLQILPKDESEAMKTIREAAFTAQSVLRCKSCTESPPARVTLPLKYLQNHMLLGTLLPVIADGYKRLLTMIDKRYESAISATPKQKIPFNAASLGGWKTISARTCSFQQCPPEDMEPELWRTAMRGLLRADVYGIDEVWGGLKGLIGEMERRQRERHDVFDRMREEGRLEGVRELSERGRGMLFVERKDRTCEKILDVARFALENLVIA